MPELVPPGRVLFLRPLKRGGERVAWDAVWCHASDNIREARARPWPRASKEPGFAHQGRW